MRRRAQIREPQSASRLVQRKEHAQRRPGGMKQKWDDQAKDAGELEFEGSHRVRITRSVLVQKGGHRSIAVKKSTCQWRRARAKGQMHMPCSWVGANPSTRTFYPLRTANNAQRVRSSRRSVARRGRRVNGGRGSELAFQTQFALLCHSSAVLRSALVARSRDDRCAVQESAKRLAGEGKPRLLCIRNRVIIGVVRDTRAWR